MGSPSNDNDNDDKQLNVKSTWKAEEPTLYIPQLKFIPQQTVWFMCENKPTKCPISEVHYRTPSDIDYLIVVSGYSGDDFYATKEELLNSMGSSIKSKTITQNKNLNRLEFEPKRLVWIMYDNIPQQGPIHKVSLRKMSNTGISYYFNSGDFDGSDSELDLDGIFRLSKNNFYRTKEELLNSLK